MVQIQIRISVLSVFNFYERLNIPAQLSMKKVL